MLLAITWNSFSQDNRLIGKWKIISVSGKGYYYNSEKDSIFLSNEFKKEFKEDIEILKKVEMLMRNTYSNAFYYFDDKGNHHEISDVRNDDYKYSVDTEKMKIKINDYQNNAFMFEIPFRIENETLYISLEQKFGIANFILKRS
jgi:hypothetical protein